MLRRRRKNTIFFAHNLAYDLTNLDYPEGSIRLISGDSRLIGAEYVIPKKRSTCRRSYHYKCRFMDTGNFFVGKSIEQLGSMMGYPKISYDITQHSGKTLAEISHEERKPLAGYCMRDAEICYRVARYLLDLTTGFKTRFRSYTAPSLALRMFRTNFMSDEWKRRPQYINDFERLAYYGGRTEVFDYRLFDSVDYEDITSSYPTAMRHKPYPRPDKYNFIYNPTWNEVKDKEGVSLVRVEVPYMKIPPLPFRRVEDGKLLFPYGEWTGAYTHPELRMAVKHGVRIAKVYESVVYDSVFDPFSTFIDEFYAKKESSKGIEREFYKLILNGLSGKFGEKRELKLKAKYTDLDLCYCPYEEGMGGSICRKCRKPVLEGMHVSGPDANGWVTLTGHRLPDPRHVFPVLIAYVTAYGRIKLYEERLNTCEALYCDTDSCISTESPGIGVGSKLGDWTQAKYHNFIAFAPKFYRYHDDGIEKLKLKGIPARSVKLYLCPGCGKEYKEKIDCCGMALDDDSIRYKFSRPMKLSEAIRRRLAPNEWQLIYKGVSFMDNKRVKLPSGKSKPIKVYEGFDIQCFNDMHDKLVRYS
jgi:hypothetical protein